MQVDIYNRSYYIVLRGTVPENQKAIIKPIERGIKAMFDASEDN